MCRVASNLKRADDLMRQAILYGAGDLRVEQRPLSADELEADQAFVETEVTAFSAGTDLGNYLGDSTYVPGAPSYPRAVGYSNVGVVRHAGKDFRQAKHGMRVFSMKPHQSAYVAGPNDLLVEVPPAVSSEQASLAYLTQLGLAALRQARYEAGENIAIVGLGVIGVCTAALARAMGAHVVAIGSAKPRLTAAGAAGAHAVFLNSDPKLDQYLETQLPTAGIDIVVLTANTWDAWRLSMHIVRRAGRVSVLGFPGRGQAAPEFNPLDPAWLYAKQLSILGSGWSPQIECSPTDVRFNLRRNLKYILDLMATGQMKIESLISHRLPADRMVEAYELARLHSKDLVAAIFDWR
jgi:threonine dehydrogenase-like Zn-dependent dehydrogenase